MLRPFRSDTPHLLVLTRHQPYFRMRKYDPAEMDAYEELLTDAVRGVSFRFGRPDCVEEAWRIVDPVLDDATPVSPYEPGTWGPSVPNATLIPDGGWFRPDRSTGLVAVRENS